MDADTVASKNYFQKVVDAVNYSYDYGFARLKSGTKTIKGHYVTESLNIGMLLSNSTGGNLFMTKSLFKKIKGFNESMKKGEDTELGLRANKNGGKIIFLKNTFLIHNE
jgi:GT2 family glycosyltransferase